jgi:hypothetical protein
MEMKVGKLAACTAASVCNQMISLVVHVYTEFPGHPLGRPQHLLPKAHVFRQEVVD